jgi:hypothetical protein
MINPTTILVTKIEQIAEYYKNNGQEADYQDLRNVLNEYYDAIDVERK